MDKSKNKLNPILMAIIFIVVILLYVILAFILDYYKNYTFLNEYSGTIEALFTGLAFGGLIYTIYQQQLTINHQSIEMDKSIDIQQRANEILSWQTEIIELQKLETGFFSHYNEFKNKLMSVEAFDQSKLHKGFKYFEHLVTRFYRETNTINDLVKSCNEAGKHYIYKPNWLKKIKQVFDSIENSIAYPETLSYLSALVLIVEFHLKCCKNPKYDGSYYQTYLRYSIEPETAKLVCLVYLWASETKYPDLFKVVDTLSLWGYFNFSDREIDKIIKDEVLLKIVEHKKKLKNESKQL